MGKFIDLTGKRFNKLLVLERTEKVKGQKPHWICKCDCGNKTIVSSTNLKRGQTKSCGCKRYESKNIKHGMTGTRIYNIWFSMRQRCYYAKNRCYNTYGAEGKTVCDEWKDNFQAFYDWAMANGYQDNLSIERIDNSKGYSPDNCKFATTIEQANNKRNNRWITYNNETHTMAEWARIKDIPYRRLKNRLQLGMQIEKALNTP